MFDVGNSPFFCVMCRLYIVWGYVTESCAYLVISETRALRHVITQSASFNYVKKRHFIINRAESADGALCKKNTFCGMDSHCMCTRYCNSSVGLRSLQRCLFD